jgi:hypothetical protein
VDAEGLVELGHELRRQLPNLRADTLDGDRSDLLSLRLGVLAQPGRPGWQQDLERVDPLGVRGHRHDGDHTPSEARGSGGVGGGVGVGVGVGLWRWSGLTAAGAG